MSREPAARRRSWTLILVPPEPGARTHRLTFGRRTFGTIATFMLAMLASMGVWAESTGANVAEATARLVYARREIVSLRDSVKSFHTQALADSLAQTRADSAPSMIMPVDGLITSRFSRSRLHPILQIFRPHSGVDLSAPTGTDIRAPADGKVMSVGWRLGYGLTIEIAHDGSVTTLYGHCRKSRVHSGEHVTAGQVIGAVGASGMATGSHLHFEVRIHGRAIDPLAYIAASHGSATSVAQRLAGEDR